MVGSASDMASERNEVQSEAQGHRRSLFRITLAHEREELKCSLNVRPTGALLLCLQGKPPMQPVLNSRYLLDDLMQGLLCVCVCGLLVSLYDITLFRQKREGTERILIEVFREHRVKRFGGALLSARRTAYQIT